MKTYLMRIPEILRGVSETLDVTATLCDRSWVVFNDEGVKILFIFERDGTLIVSRNGVVSKQSWSYIRATKAILIDNAQQSYLLHPAFIDNVVFALNQDGTQHHLFMIDEGQVGQFPMLTLDALHHYFESKVERIQLDQRRSEEEEQEATKRRFANQEIKQRTAKLKAKGNLLTIELWSVIILVPVLTFLVLSAFVVLEYAVVSTTLITLLILFPYCKLWKRREDKIYAEIAKIKADIWRKYNV